jgi:CheY-like chemotaxis protein
MFESLEAGTETILVVDDSDLARERMSSLLEDAGYRVIALSSPIGSTRAILENDVRAVVIDILMPGMRGDRLALLFRRNPRLKDLGVVLVSGESADELLQLSIESGADAVVAKADLNDLVPAVRRVLRRRDSQNPRRGHG